MIAQVEDIRGQPGEGQEIMVRCIGGSGGLLSGISDGRNMNSEGGSSARRNGGWVK